LSVLDRELSELKQKILKMGGCVERAIEESTAMLLKSDPNRLDRVFEFEANVNLAHVDIDETCFKLIAQKAPVAKDLRFILSVIKINTDLERMGDQAVNIGQNAKRALGGPDLGLMGLIEEMALLVKSVVRQALDSFVQSNLELAKGVLDRDDEVDQLKKQVLDLATVEMQKTTKNVDVGITLILVARNLERLGDHATNIAEDVIFSKTGKDIRHGGRGAQSVGFGDSEW